jgi:cytoskeletal protein CcmA (bactofilin family)
MDRRPSGQEMCQVLATAKIYGNGLYYSFTSIAPPKSPGKVENWSSSAGVDKRPALRYIGPDALAQKQFSTLEQERIHRRQNVFGKGNKNLPLDKIETIIGPNTNFDGHLKCDGSVRIDGVCEGGVIETVSNVIVSLNAMVAADIVARNVSVSGSVTGKIKASNRLEILSTGRVWGDAEVGSFLLDEDGYFRGQLVMKEEPEIPPQLAKSASTAKSNK